MRFRQLEGLVAGAAVSGAIAAIGHAVTGLTMIGAMGMPVGALLGWRMAPRLGKWRAPRLIGWMAVSAVMVGDLVVVMSMLAGSAFVPGGVGIGLVPGVLLVWIIGLAYGLFVLPLTLVASAAWFLLMRLLARVAESPRSRIARYQPPFA